MSTPLVQDIVTIFNLRKLSKLCDMQLVVIIKVFHVCITVKLHKSKVMPNILECP